MRNEYPVLAPVSRSYPEAGGRLPTCYSPVRHSSTRKRAFPFDLHVLSTPPAFVLSQDQTLHRMPYHQHHTPTQGTQHKINKQQRKPELSRATWPTKIQPAQHPRGWTPNWPYQYKKLALTIGTLLSSQRTDAHHPDSFESLRGPRYTTRTSSRFQIAWSRGHLDIAAKRASPTR